MPGKENSLEDGTPSTEDTGSVRLGWEEQFRRWSSEEPEDLWGGDIATSWELLEWEW